MPKLLKIFKNHNKKRSASPSGKKKANGIFRSSKKVEAPIIEAAITYTLSEDEEDNSTLCCDIESQVEWKGKEELISQESAFPPKEETPTSEYEQTVTFTQLEVMRNELSHMMQIANKDKEIYELQQTAEELKIQHSEELASKDEEIEEIKKVLMEKASALSVVKTKLETSEQEHIKTIEVLMKTQHDFYELQNQSLFQPLWDFFD